MFVRRFSALCALSIFAVSSTVSAPLSYTCDVAYVYEISPEGKIETSSWEAQMKGASFSVSRSTGEIIGEVVPTLLADRAWVVNPGSNSNSFKAAADFGDQIQVIEVQEYLGGQTKSFVSMSMGGAGIVTGLCR